MLNYVKQRVRERGDLHGEVTIRGGDQVGHDGDDDMRWPVRSCLTLREAPQTPESIIWPTCGSGLMLDYRLSQCCYTLFVFLLCSVFDVEYSLCAPSCSLLGLSTFED